MQLDEYLKIFPKMLREWIMQPQNEAFIQACRNAASAYMGTRTGYKKRVEAANAILFSATTENIFQVFVKTTSEDCWIADNHYYIFGCASLNTLLMHHIILAWKDSAWERLRKSEVKGKYGIHLQICEKITELQSAGTLQGHCKDIHKEMELWQQAAHTTTPAKP